MASFCNSIALISTNNDQQKKIDQVLNDRFDLNEPTKMALDVPLYTSQVINRATTGLRITVQ